MTTDTLGLPGEVKVTIGPFGLPQRVLRGPEEVEYTDESIIITDTSEYEDYASTIDDDQMWHGDVESNYLLETTAQESVDELIDNTLKTALYNTFPKLKAKDKPSADQLSEIGA